MTDPKELAEQATRDWLSKFIPHALLVSDYSPLALAADKFGFDTKNAQHLIRLLRQGIEFLRTGELEVERKDRAELIQIKQGQWSIEKVKRTAYDLFAEMEQAFNESKLPEKPDREAADKLVQEILIDFYKPLLQPA